MNDYWFTSKKWGMGWCPCSPEGWIVLISFVVAATIPALFLLLGGNVLLYLIYTAGLSMALLVIIRKKGER